MNKGVYRSARIIKERYKEVLCHGSYKCLTDFCTTTLTRTIIFQVRKLDGALHKRVSLLAIYYFLYRPTSLGNNAKNRCDYVPTNGKESITFFSWLSVQYDFQPSVFAKFSSERNCPFYNSALRKVLKS